MKASRKGTRLNDRHNFKQPLPHLRNRMTAMCVLSKISGLQDKIRSTEDHDVIVGKTERKLIPPSAKNRGGKVVRAYETDKNYRYEERESPDGNELTIKIGLERTFMEKEISYKRGKRDVADIIRHLKNDSIISVGQMNPNECTEEFEDDGHDRGYCVSIKSPLPAVPPKGIGPILQHWESMIRQKGASDSKEDNTSEKIEQHKSPFLNEATLHSKSSQFPSKAELLAGETAVGINTFSNKKRSINNNKKNRGRDVPMRTAEDTEPSASASRGRKLKRMALELLDILVANKKNANDIPSSTIMGSGIVRGSGLQTSDATRMKTIYQRIPDYKRRLKDRNIRRRTEIHGNYGDISRAESTSRVSEPTREGAINYADTCTDTSAAQNSLQKKPSAGRVTPMELNFGDWLMRELRSRH